MTSNVLGAIPDQRWQYGANSARDNEKLRAENTSDSAGARSTAKAKDTLSEQQQRELRALQKTDRAVKAHEAAHLAAAGGLATSGPTYDFKKGPDGKLYAVGGEVQVSGTNSSGDPEKAAKEAEAIQRAALAPTDPSAQDRRVAAEAAAQAAAAKAQSDSDDKVKKSNPYDAIDRTAKAGTHVDTAV